MKRPIIGVKINSAWLTAGHALQSMHVVALRSGQFDVEFRITDF